MARIKMLFYTMDSSGNIISQIPHGPIQRRRELLILSEAAVRAVGNGDCSCLDLDEENRRRLQDRC